MAGASLIFSYQWRAFWRRVLRTRRVKFYLTAVTLFGWIAAVALPDSLSRAASELAAGQTVTMDRLLLVACVLWFAVLSEDPTLSLSSHRLRRFPLAVRSLLVLKLWSLFLSPIAWLTTIVSLLILSPLLWARHAVLGTLAAVVLFAIAIGVRVTVSQLFAPTRWRSGRRVVVAATGTIVTAFALASLRQAVGSPLTAALLSANPATLVTTIAVAKGASATAVPVMILLLAAVVVWCLVRWTFPASLSGATAEPTARAPASIALFPGRLGPLVQREQRALRSVLDLWMGLVPVLAAAVLSFFVPLSSTVRQSIFVVVCALNANVTINCLGLDRPAGLVRYLILPIRGSDLFLAKNAAVAVVVAAQLALLLASGAWHSGVVPLGADILVVTVLLLAHLAWGNVVSVFEPHRIEPHRFAAGGDHVTAMVSLVIGSTPGVAVMVLLRSGSSGAAVAIAATLVATMTAYYVSVGYAGRSFERRIEIISHRLA